ncbi:HSFY1 protein, partial [Rhynochetos jubatus]|nr:HSFY1 protein [Rhynochetos jubatus]
RELPAPETSSSADPEEMDCWAPSASPSHPGGDTAASREGATTPRTEEEKAIQGLRDASWIPIMRACFSEICEQTSASSARSFLHKLWNIVSSHHFQSMRWGSYGNCIVIAEELFRMEVLGRRGPLKVFEPESMEGFLLQLNLHGFCRVELDSLLSDTIEELRAEGAAGLAQGKVRR